MLKEKKVVTFSQDERSAGLAHVSAVVTVCA